MNPIQTNVHRLEIRREKVHVRLMVRHCGGLERSEMLLTAAMVLVRYGRRLERNINLSINRVWTAAMLLGSGSGRQGELILGKTWSLIGLSN
jgi:hypothetical protein